MPAYFDATSSDGKRDWAKMTASAMTGVSITAILDPMNGPFPSATEPRNVDYATAIANMHKYNGKVIGYLPSAHSGVQFFPGTPDCPTTAGKYTVQNLIDCAMRYKLAFGNLLDGIFVDEMGPPLDGSVSVTNSMNFYRQLYDGLKNINSNWLIIGNPGAPADGFLRDYTTAAGGADILVTFENSAANYVVMTTPPYKYTESTRYAHLVHTASGYSFATLLGISKQHNVSYFFVTERSTAPGVNTFGALPLDWDAQVAAVRASPGN